jgi:MFS family permease
VLAFLQQFYNKLLARDRDAFCYLLCALSMGALLATGFGDFANINKDVVYKDLGIFGNVFLQSLTIGFIFIGATLSSAAMGRLRRRTPWLMAATIASFAGHILTAVAPNLTLFAVGQLVTGAAIGCFMSMTNAYVSQNATTEEVALKINALTQPFIMVFITVIFSIAAVTGGNWRWTTILGGLFALPLIYAIYRFAPAEQIAPRAATGRARLRGKALFTSILFPWLNQGASQPNVILNFVGGFLLLAGAPAGLVPLLGILYTLAGVVGSGISAFVWNKLQAWGVSPKLPLITGCFGIAVVLITMGLQVMHIITLPWQGILIVALLYNVCYPPSAGSGYFAVLQLQFASDEVAAAGNALGAFTCNLLTVIGIMTFQGWEQNTRSGLSYLNPYLVLGVLMAVATFLTWKIASGTKVQPAAPAHRQGWLQRVIQAAVQDAVQEALAQTAPTAPQLTLTPTATQKIEQLEQKIELLTATVQQLTQQHLVNAAVVEKVWERVKPVAEPERNKLVVGNLATSCQIAPSGTVDTPDLNLISSLQLTPTGEDTGVLRYNESTSIGVETFKGGTITTFCPTSNLSDSEDGGTNPLQLIQIADLPSAQGLDLRVMTGDCHIEIIREHGATLGALISANGQACFLVLQGAGWTLEQQGQVLVGHAGQGQSAVIVGSACNMLQAGLLMQSMMQADPSTALAKTTACWHEWLGQSSYQGPDQAQQAETNRQLLRAKLTCSLIPGRVGNLLDQFGEGHGWQPTAPTALDIASKCAQTLVAYERLDDAWGYVRSLVYSFQQGHIQANELPSNTLELLIAFRRKGGFGKQGESHQLAQALVDAVLQSWTS